MHIQNLEEFIGLAETLSFTSVAKSLFISQSALSKHISGLEKELGCILFTRSTQSITLTAEGEVLYMHAKSILREYNTSLETIAMYRRGRERTLSLGYLMGACRDFLPAAYTAFTLEHPDTNTQLLTMEPDQIYQALMQDEIDLGITLLMPNYALEEFNHQVIFEDRMGALVTSTHPLANRESISFSDISAEEILVPNRDTFPLTHRYYEQMLKHSGRGASRFTSFFDLNSLSYLLTSHKEIAIMPVHLSPLFEPRLKFIPIDEDNSSISVAAIWKKSNQKPMVQTMISCINQSYEALKKKPVSNDEPTETL